MRIVIDLQGAQSGSRRRGIGRYSLAFARALIRQGSQHEILLALNGLLSDSIEPIRAHFSDLLPREHIRLWHAPGPISEPSPTNSTRRAQAELMREAFLTSLRPDILHISSLFEGFGDDAATSLRRFDQTSLISVSLYDIIPLLHPERYLDPNPAFAAYYQRKLNALRQADLWLAISESSRREGIEHLSLPAARVHNISTAIESDFRPLPADPAAERQLDAKLGLTRPYVLYTGGADERKNLPRLIQAFAALAPELRHAHQLVIAGHMPQANSDALRHIAVRAGLASADLLLPGYVTDAELIRLYSRCRLFVFPSWHEGFGLPVLEAMNCGAPVIAANRTSLPEILQLEAALFDPEDTAAITAAMARGLTDETWRAQLIAHGEHQCQQFSWDHTARRALDAWEDALASTTTSLTTPASRYLERSCAPVRLIQALAAHLPAKPNTADDDALAISLAHNQQASTERQLFIDISELHQRNAATGVQRVVRAYLHQLLEQPPPGFRVEPVAATVASAGYGYARAFTQRFLGQADAVAQVGTEPDPIRWCRGDIFYALDLQHHVQLAQAEFFQQLRREGVRVLFQLYDLLPIQLPDAFPDTGACALHARWLRLIAGMDGAIAISQATAEAYRAWLASENIPTSPGFALDWVHIGGDIQASCPSTGLPPEADRLCAALSACPSFLSVGTLEPRKGQAQILAAFEHLWQQGRELNLVLVGQPGWGVQDLIERLRDHPQRQQQLYWLPGISDEFLERLYAVCSALIAASRNEGFGLPLVEAARHHCPVIARDIPVFRELAGDHASYFSGDTPVDLATAIDHWLAQHGGDHLQRPANTMPWLSWQQSASQLKDRLLRHGQRRQLLVDVSELCRHDASTGIQRVVKNLLDHWLQQPPSGYQVEPVYASHSQGYRYARAFTQRIQGADDWIDYSAGDDFLALDFHPGIVYARRADYRAMRQAGVRVRFVIYDLLCHHLPQCFDTALVRDFAHWLEVVGENHGAFCISQAVAAELRTWHRAAYPDTPPERFAINWFHLGADFTRARPSRGLPADAPARLARLRAATSLLMVGTIEPRKGHAQVLEACEQLWPSTPDLHLVLVGKPGWKMDSFLARLRQHPERDQRLHWIDAASDEYLEQLYAAASGLIAASLGEGFGLPLIEAAQHHLPILARDLPVFREVAGAHASYFNASNGPALATALADWLQALRTGQAPASNAMPRLDWAASAAQLAKRLTDQPPTTNHSPLTTHH